MKLAMDDLFYLASEAIVLSSLEPCAQQSPRSTGRATSADPRYFDAVITDERMPGMLGSALIRKLRSVRDGIPASPVTVEPLRKRRTSTVEGRASPERCCP